MATIAQGTGHRGRTQPGEGDHETTTQQKPKINVKEVATSTVKDFSQDDCSGMAAESAYHILFSLFPLAIFGAAMSAVINRVYNLDLFNKIMNGLITVLPPDAQTTISGPLKEVLSKQSGGLLSFGLVTALWSGSAAVSTFIKALNRAYDVEETRPFWKRKGLEILLTLAIGVVMVAAFIMIVPGRAIGNALATKLGLGHIFNVVWTIGRWPLILVFISLSLAVLYWIGPNIKHEFKWISPGAVLATIVWVAAILGFGLYVSTIGGSGYTKTYGAFGGVIVLLLVFYLSSMIVMFGGELNSEVAKRYDPKAIRDIAAHPEKDKGETIYAEKAPNKKPAERESDLKGAEARSGDATQDISPATRNDGSARNDSATVNAAVRGDAKGEQTATQRERQKIANYGTGKRAEPPKDDPNAAYRMTASRATMSPDNQPPASKPGMIGVGVMAAGALAMGLKNFFQKR